MKLLQIIVILITAFVGSFAFSKELVNRLGIGGRQHSTIGVKEVIASYYPYPELGFVGGLGVDTQENNSKFTFNAEMRRIVFKEDNMNFYMSGKFGILNNESSGQKSSGYELSALFGGEFFLHGLDNLGFLFQAGVGVLSLNTVRFVTIGDSPVTAGIVFYF